MILSLKNDMGAKFSSHVVYPLNFYLSSILENQHSTIAGDPQRSHPTSANNKKIYAALEFFAGYPLKNQQTSGAVHMKTRAIIGDPHVPIVRSCSNFKKER
ncbi:hypothetical protein [Siccibacter colletis]|uniref:Uncharacterized protein n=1 Tax=Siccibacter colletis TaxID=1505757 RepID=A0ABY6JDN0_9ENTR|nr:hypothetical protein [Siccibacter colletis]UYU30511.1 hypothetical protein KFZ77_11465 [Siccibacter colletis]